MVKCMADPLDKILTTMKLLPCDIEKYCARYGNLKLLRGYNKLHLGLVKYAVKGGQLVVLKFLLMQDQPRCELIKEYADALVYACRYGRVDILKFLKSHCLDNVDGNANYNVDGNANYNADQRISVWKASQTYYVDKESIYYAIKNDNLDCFIWIIENMDGIVHINTIYIYDSVKILKYLHTVRNGATVSDDHFDPNYIRMGVDSNSIECLQFAYSIKPFEIKCSYLETAIRRSHIPMLRWFNSITDISKYVDSITDSCGIGMWTVLTDEQLERCLGRLIIKQRVLYVKYCISRKIMTEKLFILCCESLIYESSLTEIFDLYMGTANAVSTDTLHHAKNIAHRKGYDEIIARIDDYMS